LVTKYQFYFLFKKVSGGILCALHKKTAVQRAISDSNEVIEEIQCRICQSSQTVKDENFKENAKFFLDLFPR
jgi:uncharacterized Zn finger protein (UPF0148 family)